MDELNNKFGKNPSEYWKLLDELRHISKEEGDDNKVSPNIWHDHFKNLLGTNDIDKVKDDEMLKKIKALEDGCIDYPEDLNKEISKDEIFEVILSLKNKKAVSLDRISNEMIKTSWTRGL